DGIDNNGNGKIDMADSNCLSPYDDFEGTAPQHNEDEAMLFPTTVSVINDATGNHAIVKNGQTTLADLRVFFGSSSSLQNTVTYIPTAGGVDVNILIKNPTSSPVPHPDFTLYGLKHRMSGQANLIGSSSNSFVIDNPSTYYSGGYVWAGIYTYTDMYSPLYIIDDGNFSSGVSLGFPYLEYGYDPELALYIDRIGASNTVDPNGNWSVRFLNFPQTDSLRNYGGTAASDSRGNVPASTTRNYTISVRFSNPRNAIFTALPYKRYFENLYGPRTGTVSNRDRRPVRADVLADSIGHTNPADFNSPIDPAVLRDNPRRYVTGYKYSDIGRVDKYGWKNLTDYWLSESILKGYKRYMLWAAGGLYENENFNYPPHMMSFWLPNVSNSAGNFSRFAPAGISLGFWWGRTLQVPVPDQWEPPNLEYLNFSRRAHQQFVKRELSLALNRSVRELGLDAFKAAPIQRYLYLKTIKMLAPSVRPTQEVYTSDLFNGDADVWNGEAYNAADLPKSPAILSAYLNPSSAIWYRVHDSSLNASGVQRRVGDAQKLMEMGYTPVFGNDVPDVRSLVTPSLPKIFACYDGIDNDGDGKADLYDSGCDNITDTTE
ncbi:hypothetical protein KW787_03180, partial [Candidatus Pacearchaeota archaeon]|nr:hypothetical protein [Candidatus Pacearchaeota archaeon]